VFRTTFALAIALGVVCSEFLTNAPIARSAERAQVDSTKVPAPAGDDLGVIPRPRSSHVRPGCSVDAPELLQTLESSLDPLEGRVKLFDSRLRVAMATTATHPATSAAYRRAFEKIAVRLRWDKEREIFRAAKAGNDLLAARWHDLGIREHEGGLASFAFRPEPKIAAQAYRLTVVREGIEIASSDADGTFYAFTTLAQLARRTPSGRWIVPCVTIDDGPALKWRILSDDVSRGPLPTMNYFKERIRTIAAFKMNGYSPYMEHVFLDPKHPLPSPLDGITPAQLRELAEYAARYRVTLIPEQQTFAHMHESLRWERYAPLAELPHGYLLAPQNPAGEAYVRDLIADELAAIPHPPFFHIGSDEPSDLGRGISKPLVDANGEGPTYTKHVVDTANFVMAQGGARPMIWDDALSRHPELFSTLPKQLVFVNWHYGTEKTYAPYIDRIAKGGFDQMISPGALNWNEIYPDLDAGLANIGTFVNEGKARHVLGLFQTVWHDDGETLFEATWYPVVFAAANAWESASVEPARFAADFPRAFFGSDDARYATDLADLALAGKLVRENPREYGDYLFWSDPFQPDLQHALAPQATTGLRLAAERVVAHLKSAPPPPLHANAARVMEFAALRYDLLGRDVQIANEARDYYALAQSNLAKGDSYVYRNLLVVKYLLWEQRDRMLELVPLARATWEYENRASHEESVLARYRVAADRAILRADAMNDATYREFVAHKRLPSFEEALGLPAAAGPIDAPSPQPEPTAR
jgi:hypothetical protein